MGLLSEEKLSMGSTRNFTVLDGAMQIARHWRRAMPERS